MAWFGKGQDGVGIICGAVSGNLEMLELEGRAVAKASHRGPREIFEKSQHEELWTRLVNGYMEATPSGGIHWLYRVSDGAIPGNTKIAQAAGEDGGCLAETRGEGGFVISSSVGRKVPPIWKPLADQRRIDRNHSNIYDGRESNDSPILCHVRRSTKG